MHVFSGSKRRSKLPIPSLKTLCTMTICDHLDMLTSVGDVPDELVVPILTRCTPEQLLVVEAHTDRKLPTAPMWQRHCEKLQLGEEAREVDGRKLSWKQVWKNEQKRIAQRKEEVALRLRKMYTEAEAAKKHRATKQITAAAPKPRSWTFGRSSGPGGVVYSPPTTARARLAKKIGAPRSTGPPIISPAARKLQLASGSSSSSSSSLSSGPRRPSNGALGTNGFHKSSTISPSKPSTTTRKQLTSPSQRPSTSSSPSSSSSSASINRVSVPPRAPLRPTTTKAPSSSFPVSSSTMSSASSVRTPMSTTARSASPPLLPVVPAPVSRKKKRPELDMPSFTKLSKAQRPK